ncbi:MAG TPA: DegT/DnrJ/EryC1/StrS family aminotransferase [Tepidisphaeraceae bacterium]|nr:DegT/DnrJ/EryC1/StrS family aminotransferase [Tepidisphaeraceae bacterium]
MKTKFSELALFGGPPAFAQPVHVGRPNVGDRKKLLARFEEILDRNVLTNDGPCVRDFEARVAELAGVKHCVACCNATIALEIASRALGLTGEVIVPSFTFVATAHALQWQEITPVFCDVDPLTHNLDPAAVERMITPRTTGIIGVHLWGRPCDVTALQAIARRHNLKLLFDAAHAFACSSGGRMVGSFGDAEVFSFHATKFLNTFEGGAVVTNDDDLAHKLRLMRNFGFAGYDNVIYIGTNGKMCETSAAMGLTGLDALDQFIDVNRTNHHAYRDALSGLPGVRLLEYNERERCNYQYVPVEIDAQAAGLHRDMLIAVLHREGILARRYFYPGCHLMQPYRSLFPHARLLLAHTESLCDRILVLPTGTAVAPDDIRMICGIIRLALRHAGDVSKKLAPGSAAPEPA